ncbi:MAG: calcium-binding protein [Polyangiaceae bacterium]
MNSLAHRGLSFVLSLGALAAAVGGCDVGETTGTAIAGQSCAVLGDEDDCADGTGAATCQKGADDKLVWSACIKGECGANDLESCGANGMRHCIVDAEGVGSWSGCEDTSAASTPIVLAFGGEAVTYAQMGPSSAAFALDAEQSVVTDWPTSATPWLALDRDHDGVIDDGGELFGSATRLSTGDLAPNGFVALAALDDDGDGRITPRDAAFADLVAWADADGDRVSTARELTRIIDLGVESLDARYVIQRSCDGRGNCEIERAEFTWRSASGELRSGAAVDVHLAHQR